MLRLVGYQNLTQIYAGTRTLVYRGIREEDQKPIVIKMLRYEYPSFSELVQFRNQYTITKNLHISGIIKTYSLENYENSYALVMEDFGGVSLKDWSIQNSEISLDEFFHIAIQIVTILDGLYRSRVIHKDIKPSNILINPITKEIRLIDFGIASLLPRETQTLTSPNVLEGTLAYLSPEQTGRMNRGIDYRSDFYSLGVTFFELLTGQLPFYCDDPMKLLHCHIAKRPPQVHDINSTIPLAVSNIAFKLMAKNAEDRYQSALGLKHDLETCWKQWQTQGEISVFELGSRDICDRFIIPEKLYGRQAEVQQLLAAFERVSQGNREMILVAGFSGIGKTAIVNEIHKPIVKQSGYFIKGKYDQFQRNIPLSAIVQSFQDLMGQLLSEANTQIQDWKTQILAALGEQGQVIIDVIPELQSIIGQQRQVTELEPSAAQNRFSTLFLKFIQVFTTKEHPLVIFLDDLQWADSASLKLIQLLMSQIDNHYLLLIGAYRDNEVSSGHPLILTLQDIQKHAENIETITLKPLNTLDLNYLVADTLKCTTEVALPLTQLVYQKTQGNPFFSNQFLKYLYNENLISFNFEKGFWECNIAQVKTLSLTDDVVDFMSLQLQKLPEVTQNVLKLAACINNHFNLSVLANIYEKSLPETAAALWTALREGLIIPTNKVYRFFQEDLSLDDSQKLNNNIEPITVEYKFLHDRVQQAAYTLIPENDKNFTHLKIGQLMLVNSTPEIREEKIFEIVNQFNIGVDLITAAPARHELAQLNLQAGTKAKSATAYGAAVEYINSGIELLTASCWEDQYELTLSLYLEAVEVAYLSTEFHRMEILAETVLENAKALLDKVKIYSIKIQACIAQNQLLLGIETALPVLQMLGVNLPPKPTQTDIVKSLQAANSVLMGNKTSDLINLPKMDNPEKLAALSILSSMFGAAYNGYPAMFPPLICEEIILSVKYGNAPVSAFAYASYGAILLTFMGDIDAGYEFGNLALNLVSKLDAKEIKAKTFCVVNCLIKHWKKPLKSTFPLFIEGYHSGWETGDLEWSAWCAFSYTLYLYLSGTELYSLEQEMSSYAQAIAQFKQKTSLNYLNIYYQSVYCLLGDTENQLQIKGHIYDEEVMLPIHQQASDRPAIYHLYINKLILCYLFCDYEQAIKHAEIAEQYLDGVLGIYVVVLLPFYDSLARLALYPHTTVDIQQEILHKVSENQAKIKQWADYAPMNHQHKFYLVAAEQNRVLGKYLEAMNYYDLAIAEAKENKYLQEEALASELAAKFYWESGKEKIAQVYFTDAYYAYTRWGAIAKVKDLEQRYPQMFALLSRRSNLIFNPNDTIVKNDSTSSHIHQTQQNTHYYSTTISNVLDLSSVIKASQTLASEIKLEKLLSTLMELVIENAGAKKCVLVLLKNERLLIEAIAKINQVPISTILVSIPIAESDEIPISLINYVSHTSQTLVIDDATTEDLFISDPYIQQKEPKSLLCTPIIKQGKLMGILYLENHLTTGAFTSDRLQVINLLMAQAAISLENAQLYGQLAEYSQNLELKVEQRTQELKEKANQLESALQKLSSTQSQLVQAEKMSSLGQLVAGIAHEINNPVSFIYGNLTYTSEYVNSLLELINLYQKLYSQPLPEIQQKISDMELDFITEDLPKMLKSMRFGAERIEEIVSSLRMFARLDEAGIKRVDIHSGIDSTLLILQHRLKFKQNRQSLPIAVKQNYGNIPQIYCYASELNQVFISILSNAIDALQEDVSNQPGREKQPTITISTEVKNAESILIRIADNGPGMSNAVLGKIFDPFFTTKPVGSGTGLGLSISYAIVVEKHGGQLLCSSSPGMGTEFTIEIPIQTFDTAISRETTNTNAKLRKCESA
ncbi:trifunctional serine/threonine-protein kinase/ATP-binding protein/sensor histidine kinase [Anabaena sp. FACHB-709]|uniref:histidine kinase n=2 Tax=Nostocaceae TaxID=1162 RepID=A0A1Z4KS79_ANAVA|nr:MULTISPECIES: ATP-binding sensor histidine kinase [Nostocaceae]BAY71856.1 serine/threonine protein kinase with two-component sensor domain [Trichormus variabilis NIES-23]HBW33765.1 serine/threonine protein kinase [Nostoc sp. UBA8866]MBD2172237.1 AAA family ATPase [Anabaena cylindrica FACHB-318]MBD2263942.1 AAA family ATPase [Anabaena sp. FACHB-709]MBD2273178.1 AAA family ATPase [Nostoc sp. PCC 7120 = FACHB-418]